MQTIASMHLDFEIVGSAYLGLLAAALVCGVALLFRARWRRVGILVLSSVLVSVVVLLAAHELYPLFCPKPGGSGDIYRDMDASVAYAVRRAVDTICAGYAGLAAGWIPAWLVLRFKKKTAARVDERVA